MSDLFTYDPCNEPEFETYRAMSLDELVGLLHADEPRIRVRAAWALGVSDDDVVSPLTRRLEQEDVAGVRRHLMVVLAGLDEIDPIAALARFDTDPYVRSTGALYAARLGPAHPELFAIVETCLADSVAVVRRNALVGLNLDDAPFGVHTCVRGLLEDPDSEVRRLAHLRLFGDEPQETTDSVAATEPPDDDLVGELMPYGGSDD